jgi:hypothetical protein
VSLSLEAARLIDSAVNLMDSPIPPGSQSGSGDSGLPGGSGPPGGGQGEPGGGDTFLQVQ